MKQATPDGVALEPRILDLLVDRGSRWLAYESALIARVRQDDARLKDVRRYDPPLSRACHYVLDACERLPARPLVDAVTFLLEDDGFEPNDVTAQICQLAKLAAEAEAEEIREVARSFDMLLAEIAAWHRDRLPWRAAA